MTADEAETRRIAYALKDPTSQESVFQMAAREMSRLIEGHCSLIPVPDHHGTVTANLHLCIAIADLLPAVKVIACLTRSEGVESQIERHKQRKGPLTIQEHKIVRKGAQTVMLPCWYVDNVVTSGTTLRACRAAMGGFGGGLVWADAGRTRMELAYLTWG